MKNHYLIVAFMLTAIFNFSYAQVNDTGDKVGIGITAPNEKLEVTGNVLVRNPSQNSALIISASNAGYGVDPELYIQAAEASGGDGAPYHISRNAYFQTSNDTYKYVDDAGVAASGVVFDNAGNTEFRYANPGTGTINWKSRIFIEGANGYVGIGTNTPQTPLSMGRFGKARTIAVHDAPNDWYGMGMGPYQMRFQIGKAASRFAFYSGDTDEVFSIRGNGRVGIGTSSPTRTLEVKGEIRGDTFSAVTPPSWPDFVFENDYDLQSLESLETYIKENKHLPEVPSAAEVKAGGGFNMVDMDIRMLQKVEELTLYLIKQNKLLKAQQKEIEDLKKKVKE